MQVQFKFDSPPRLYQTPKVQFGIGAPLVYLVIVIFVGIGFGQDWYGALRLALVALYGILYGILALFVGVFWFLLGGESVGVFADHTLIRLGFESTSLSQWVFGIPIVIATMLNVILVIAMGHIIGHYAKEEMDRAYAEFKQKRNK